MVNELDELLKNELSLDDLDEINGGRIKVAGYGLLTAMMAMQKKLGN